MYIWTRDVATFHFEIINILSIAIFCSKRKEVTSRRFPRNKLIYGWKESESPLKNAMYIWEAKKLSKFSIPLYSTRH